MDIEFILFRIALVVYLVSAVTFIGSTIFPNRKVTRVGFSLALIALLLNGASLVFRGVATGYPPFTNLYETLSLFSFFLALAFIFFSVRHRGRMEVLGFSIMPLIVLAMLIGFVNYTEAGELVPALRSFWLFIHVPIAIFSYALFALAFIGGILYVVKDRLISESSSLSRLPSLAVLDNIIYRTIAAGFIFLTIGIVTGSVWAEAAWGRYWGWDPKETWSLITWITYAIYLHARMVRGWHGKRSAIIAIISFAAVLFTYFGVNLIPGLHTY